MYVRVTSASAAVICVSTAHDMRGRLRCLYEYVVRVVLAGACAHAE
jgi:hypothetical protein